jgi:hypothetical protein
VIVIVDDRPKRPSKNPSGKAKTLDFELIAKLAKNFYTVDEIAAACECSGQTVERRAKDLINNGRNVAKGMLRSRQFQVAMGRDPKPAEYKNGEKVKDAVPGSPPNITMLIWLGKQYLGQSDKFTTELRGEGFEFTED